MAQQQHVTLQGVAAGGSAVQEDSQQTLQALRPEAAGFLGISSISPASAEQHITTTEYPLYLRKTGAGAALVAHLLDEDLSQAALSTRVVLEVEAVKAVEDVFVRVHV